jgi:hypothetical protein
MGAHPADGARTIGSSAVTTDQAVVLAVGGLTLLCLVQLALVVRVRATARRATSELAQLRRRLDDLEQERALPPAAQAPVASMAEFLITDLGQDRPDPEPAHLDAPGFADLVLKETVVKAAALAQGLRHGLAPATRNRIRFEMKQEVRRARKQRRADLKAAERDLRVRQRATLAEEAS